MSAGALLVSMAKRDAPDAVSIGPLPLGAGGRGVEAIGSPVAGSSGVAPELGAAAPFITFASSWDEAMMVREVQDRVCYAHMSVGCRDCAAAVHLSRPIDQP